MFTLKCEFCGYEQNVKKKIDKYTYYELTHCKHLWCPCNKCKEQHPRPRNFTNDEVMHGWVFGEWDCVLNIECIFRKNRALAPHERSAVPLGTDHCPVG